MVAKAAPRDNAGETLRTLDDIERKLEADDLVIIDGEGAVAIAGVMGGASTQVTETTTRILLESAVFDPKAVRRTSKRLGLQSESSYRFERGVDVDGVPRASARAAVLFGAHAGAKAGGLVEAYAKPAAPRVLTLAPSHARAILGMELTDDEVRGHLAALGLTVATGAQGLSVTIPHARPDLERSIDLVEEVGRLAGYDRMPATLPAIGRLGADARPPALEGVALEVLADAARDALSAAGLSEAQTYAFTSTQRLLALRHPPGHRAHPGAAIAIKNPIRDDHTVLRTSLVPNLVAAAARARASFVADVRLFEVGRIFLASGKDLPDEPLFAAGVLVGTRTGWLKDGGPLEFWDARAVVEELGGRLGVPLTFVQARNEDGFLHPGVAASIQHGGQHLGVVGELHPETRDRLGLEAPGFAFELNLSLIGERPAHKLAPIPRFPAITRDGSFLVDDLPRRRPDPDRRRGRPGPREARPDPPGRRWRSSTVVQR